MRGRWKGDLLPPSLRPDLGWILRGLYLRKTGVASSGPERGLCIGLLKTGIQRLLCMHVYMHACVSLSYIQQNRDHAHRIGACCWLLCAALLHQRTI